MFNVVMLHVSLHLFGAPHTAVHHNDCMYLAHHLLTLGHQFRAQLPEPLNQGAATFLDLVPKLRRLGTQCFMDQMTRQKALMLEYLASAQGQHGLLKALL